MPEDRIYEDLTVVRRRANAVFWIFAVLTFLALSYYWKVQILEHRKYLDLAEANRIRIARSGRPAGPDPRPGREHPGRQHGRVQGLARPGERQGRGGLLRRDQPASGHRRTDAPGARGPA